MLRKTLLTLSASVMLGTTVIAPNAALAQLPGPPPIGPGGPPLGGPPPGLGAGGSPLGGPPPAHAFGGPPRGLEGGPVHRGAGAPPRFSHLDGASGVHGVDHAVHGNLHGFEGRAAAFGHTTNNCVNNSYANYGYGYGSQGRYGDDAYGGDSYAPDDGCYYVSAYSRHAYRRGLVCSSN